MVDFGSLRKRLRQWNSLCFGNISRNVRAAEAEILAKELEYDTLRDEQSRERLHRARAQHARQLSIEAAFWRHKSSIKWIKQSDALF